MRNGDIVMLALRTFLREIGGKGWVPKANVFGGIVDRIAQVSGASLFHVGIAVLELP